MKEENEKFYLTTAPIKELLLKFSIPCVLGMLVSALYNIVDQIFIGRKIGYIGNAATTVVYPFTVIALAIGLLIGDGCAALFSISLGSKDSKTSKKCVGNSIITSVFLGLLLTIIGFIFRDSILHLFGVTEASYCYASQYINIILIGMPFYILTATMGSIIRADGAPGYSMIATVVGAIINIILDPIAIFTLNLDVQGAAIATIIGQVVSCIFCIIYFKKPKLIKFEKDSFKLDFKIIRKVCKLGLSSFITQISIAVITCVANNVIVNANSSVYGADIPLSALGIVFKVFGIIISFCVGIAVGGQPIIGYNYGAKKYKRVRETYKLIIGANLIVGILGMLIFELLPQQVVNIFGSESELYNQYACMSFRIYLSGILLCCIQKASCIFLQSIDKPFKAMMLSLMRDVIFLVPGVCILTNLFGVEGMLWAGPIADILAFMFTIFFVVFEYRKLIKLDNENNSEKSTEDYSKHFVISIGREFGSGGKYIGQELARLLNVKCYDNELITKVSENYNVDINMLKNIDEKQKSSFWYSFANNYVFSNNDGEVMPISAEDDLFLKQAKEIEKLYDTENCIIIGRCSDYVLKDKENVISVFIYASDINFKIKRKVEFDNLSRDKAIKAIEKTDKERANYYKKFTSKNWGDKNNYEICMDTSKIGVESTIQLLYEYINKRIK